MLLRVLGMLVLSTGLAAAQAPADRAYRGANRDARADRVRPVAQTPAERGSRLVARDTQTNRPRVAAQTPAERASRSLEQDVRGDRFRDAAEDARGDPRPTRPEVLQFEPQRRSLQPDVGRPEQQGLTSTGNSAGRSSSMGQNPQR